MFFSQDPRILALNSTGYLSHPFLHIPPALTATGSPPPRRRRRRRLVLTPSLVCVPVTCDHEANPGSEAVALFLLDNTAPLKFRELSLVLHPT